MQNAAELVPEKKTKKEKLFLILWFILPRNFAVVNDLKLKISNVIHGAEAFLKMWGDKLIKFRNEIQGFDILFFFYQGLQSKFWTASIGKWYNSCI